MIQQIQLTAQELEMIAIKREREELEKKEAEVKAKIALEKEIEKRAIWVKNQQDKENKKLETSKLYLEEFTKAGFTMIKKETNELAKVLGPNNEILWSMPLIRFSICFEKCQHRVNLHEYYKQTIWRSTFDGFRLYTEGPGIDWNNRPLSKASTAIKNINEAIEKIEEKKKEEINKKNAVAKTMDNFKENFPDAKITQDYEYGKTQRYDIVNVTFANGANISFRVYSDGSLSTRSYSFPVKGTKDIMNILNEMSF